MRTFVFFIARFYPFFALAFALLFFDLGRHFRRRKDRRQWGFWAVCGFFLLTTLLWLVFRGDMNSEKWVRQVLGS